MEPRILRGVASSILADQVRATLRDVRGEPIEVVIRKPRTQRSLSQNDYAHKWPFRLIADAMGEGIEAAKLDILGEKFGWTVSPYSGKPIPIKASTANLTVAEFDDLIEWMPPFGLHTFGISIPLPNEAPDAAA